MMIGPIEESFAMMNRYGLHYPSSDAERVDGLTYAWKKLTSQVSKNTIQIQGVDEVRALGFLRNQSRI